MEVLFKPCWSNDVQIDDSSMVGSLVHPFPRLWPLTLDPDWTTIPLLWRRSLLSWTCGRKRFPGGVSHCWVCSASRWLGCGSGLNWCLCYQQPRTVIILDKLDKRKYSNWLIIFHILKMCIEALDIFLYYLGPGCLYCGHYCKYMLFMLTGV